MRRSESCWGAAAPKPPLRAPFAVGARGPPPLERLRRRRAARAVLVATLTEDGEAKRAARRREAGVTVWSDSRINMPELVRELLPRPPGGFGGRNPKAERPKGAHMHPRFPRVHFRPPSTGALCERERERVPRELVSSPGNSSARSGCWTRTEDRVVNRPSPTESLGGGGRGF